MELLGRDAVVRGFIPPMNEYEAYKKERETEVEEKAAPSAGVTDADEIGEKKSE